MTRSALTREDYLNLKWHVLLLLCCLGLVAAGFVYTSQLRTEATRQLNIARSDMNSAQNQLDQAAVEGETISAYLERYAAISASGVVQAGNRLAMQERFTQIRSRYNLFPIQLQIGSQSAYSLPYPGPATVNDASVRLLTSEIQASLPLLHEGDLANLLSAIQEAPDLLLARDCRLRSGSRNASDYLRLDQHQDANCTFLWYNFEVVEETP